MNMNMNSIAQQIEMPKTVIDYDRQAKSWRAVNGTTTLTGPGKEGKRQACLVALAHDCPPLAELVDSTARSNRDDTKIVDTAIKAAQLLMAGNVYRGEVESQTRPGVFHQTRYEGQPKIYECSCSCEAHRFWPVYLVGMGRICKHGLAQHFADLLGLELIVPPIPFEGQPVVVEEFNSI